MKKKVMVSKLEDHVGYWLRCLSNYVSESFAHKIAQHGISVEQWVVLRNLFNQEGITLQETSDLVGVDNSSLSRMVERLVRKDLVIRSTHPKSRRTVLLTLSSKAKKLVPILAQEADQNDAEFFRKIDTVKKAQLLNIVKELLTVNGWDLKSRGKDAMK